MKPFVVFAAFMLLMSLVNLARKPLRRGIFGSLALGWACVGAASYLGWNWLFVPSGVGFVSAMILSLTWKKRQLADLERMMGWTPEKKAEMEAEFEREEAEREAEVLREEKQQRRAEEFAREYAIEAKQKAVFITVEVPNKASFPVDGEEGELRFEPGTVHLMLEIQKAETDQEETMLLVSTSVRDQTGQAWVCSSYVMSSTLMEPAVGHDEKSAPNFVAWTNASDGWQLSMRENALFAEAQALMDSRDYYEIRVDGDLFTIPEKYQGPSMDLAWHGASRKFLVRVAGLYFAVEDGDFGADNTVPPFVFELEPESLALPVSASCHWKGPEDWMDFDAENPERPISSFQKTHLKANLSVSETVSLQRDA